VVTIHFEHDGKPISIVLNLVEVARSHSGMNLAAVFAQILDEFGISSKVNFSISVLNLLTCSFQLLCITCDNASPNDTMIDELSNRIITFPGDKNHARCFNHVIALVAKGSICQFDVSEGHADAALDDAERELKDLAEGIDIENETTRDESGADGEDDDVDGWVDEVACLSVADRKELEASIMPVRLVLVKVSLTYAKSAVLDRTHPNALIAAKNCICNPTFDYTPPSLVVPNARIA